MLSGSTSGGSAALLSTLDYMVIDYLQSQQAVVDSQRTLKLTNMFNSTQLDPIHRFWWGNGSFERLTEYWRTFVLKASFDPSSGLCDVHVSAYSPIDSERLAQTLVQLSEQLVNEQSARQRKDSVTYAERSLAAAQQRLNQALSAERGFRQAHESIDPSTNGTANLTLAASLQQNLATLKAQRNALQKLSADSPSLPVLDQQIRAAQQQLTSVAGQVGSGDMSAGAGRDKAAIASAMERYEAIEAEKGFATANYTSMLQNLTNMNTNASQQQYYLEPYVRPIRAQTPLYPKRIADISLTFVTTLALWGIGGLFYQGAKRHA